MIGRLNLRLAKEKGQEIDEKQIRELAQTWPPAIANFVINRKNPHLQGSYFSMATVQSLFYILWISVARKQAAPK